MLNGKHNTYLGVLRKCLGLFSAMNWEAPKFSLCKFIIFYLNFDIAYLITNIIFFASEIIAITLIHFYYFRKLFFLI